MTSMKIPLTKVGHVPDSSPIALIYQSKFDSSVIEEYNTIL